MRNVVYLFGIVLVVALAGVSRAQSSSNLAREDADLQKRIDKLDKELEDLKKSIAQQAGTEDGTAPKVVWSNLDIQLYGYLKLDAAYDSSRIENGNYAKWVERENTNSNDDQFNMTANETRLGMLINGPDNADVKTSGRAEVDFYEGGAENKARLMMRHVYLKLDWPEDRFSIIAGQTSDVISPLVPSTVNYSVCWWVGNIGYRRPQIRFTKEVSQSGNVDWKFEGAFARTIGRDNTTLAGTTDSGEDAGFPSVQGRVSVTLPLYGPKRSTIGLSGHKGKEEYELNTSGHDKEFTSWSMNADFTHPVKSWLAIKAEAFTGENLDAYLGGIGQGVTTTGLNQYDEIRSTGGWIAASLGPWDKMRFNTGVSMDEVERGNVNSGDRTVNRSVFGNMFYSVNKQTEVAFELSHWNTDYKGTGDAESVRAQLAFIYKF